jgi:hypothetical protein
MISRAPHHVALLGKHDVWRGLDAEQLGQLVPDVLTVMLRQCGYAVLPPRRPAAVAAVLHAAGRLDHEESLYDASHLEPWQPCLVNVRLPRRAEDCRKFPAEQESKERTKGSDVKAVVHSTGPGGGPQFLHQGTAPGR